MIGGKWTTYRRMAQDAIDKAIDMKLLDNKECGTKHFKIHGYKEKPNLNDHLYVYGSDIEIIKSIMDEKPLYNEKLSPKYGYTVAEVIYAVRHEMALTVEDVLARRVRMLFLDARVAMEIAPRVAQVMAQEMGKDEVWIENETKKFREVASNYILN